MKIIRLRSFMARDANRPRVIVAIDTDAGITGWGECYNHGPDRALPPILDYFFEQINGEDPRRIEFLMLKLQQQARFPGGAMHLVGIFSDRPLPLGYHRQGARHAGVSPAGRRSARPRPRLFRRLHRA